MPLQTLKKRKEGRKKIKERKNRSEFKKGKEVREKSKSGEKSFGITTTLGSSSLLR